MGSFDAMGSISTGLSIAKSFGLGVRIDPAMAHRFSVEIDGLIVGGFTEVSGLTATIKPVQIPEGGQNSFTEQRRGQLTFPNLVLKRGITTADMLWLWHQDVLSGKITRRNGSIVLLTEDIAELWRWDFHDAYPVVWTGPSFHADQALVAFESIELVHRGITKDMGIGPVSVANISAGISAMG
jgi:phage tail-like protein